MAIQFEIETFESESIQHSLGEYWMRASDQIQLLNRFVFLDWASARVLAGWVPAAEELEWKCKMSRFLWQDMKTAELLRARKEELSGNSKVLIPSEKLQLFVQEAPAADGFFAFIAGWFLEVKKGVIDAYERYLEALDPIFDAPTLEMFDGILPKKRKQLAWAQRLVHDAVKDPKVLESVQRWRKYTRQYLLYLGGVDERLPSAADKPVSPVTEPYGPSPKKRSKPKWLKHAELGEAPTEFRDNLKIFMWHYATEIQVVDPMCYVFFGVDDMPFEFYVDFSRHIWDESRHHQMGARRLQQMGFDLREIPLPYQDDPIKLLEEYYEDLTMIGESCSFGRKKKSMEAYYSKGDILSGMTAEIDILDERSHVKYGKKWVPVMHSQRLADNSSLDDIVRGIIDRWMDKIKQGGMTELMEPEGKSISHFAFCGKVEFRNLNFDKL